MIFEQRSRFNVPGLYLAPVFVVKEDIAYETERKSSIFATACEYRARSFGRRNASLRGSRHVLSPMVDKRLHHFHNRVGGQSLGVELLLG
jgi:hypothetical protein